jgi:hypothetical protein
MAGTTPTGKSLMRIIPVEERRQLSVISHQLSVKTDLTDS